MKKAGIWALRILAVIAFCYSCKFARFGMPYLRQRMGGTVSIFSKVFDIVLPYLIILALQICITLAFWHKPKTRARTVLYHCAILVLVVGFRMYISLYNVNGGTSWSVVLLGWLEDMPPVLLMHGLARRFS